MSRNTETLASYCLAGNVLPRRVKTISVDIRFVHLHTGALLAPAREFAGEKEERRTQQRITCGPAGRALAEKVFQEGYCDCSREPLAVHGTKDPDNVFLKPRNGDDNYIIGDES